MIISMKGDPAPRRHFAYRRDQAAAHVAVKGTPMAGAGIYLAARPPPSKDIQTAPTTS